jgi:hypothetical protein
MTDNPIDLASAVAELVKSARPGKRPRQIEDDSQELRCRSTAMTVCRFAPRTIAGAFRG